MKQITVTIPDNKESLFIEMMKSISFVKKIEETGSVPQWHKETIDQRTENYKSAPQDYKDWNNVQEDIDRKYGL